MEDGVYVCTNKVPRYHEANPRECPPQYCGRSDTDELVNRGRSTEYATGCFGLTGTNRDRYPDELSVPPHGNGLGHTPFSQPIVPQCNPNKRWPSQTINIDKRKSGAKQAEVIVDRFVGEVGNNGVGERGKNVEAEYEGC